MNPELRSAIMTAAQALGVDPTDLATAISYETGGSYDPWQRGPTTKWGTHRGLIQWGEPQRAAYGVTKDTSVKDQMSAVVRYLKDAGVRPGAKLGDIYSAINAGRVGRPNASDRPGWTVASHVTEMERSTKPKVARDLAGQPNGIGGVADSTPGWPSQSTAMAYADEGRSPSFDPTSPASGSRAASDMQADQPTDPLVKALMQINDPDVRQATPDDQTRRLEMAKILSGNGASLFAPDFDPISGGSKFTTYRQPDGSWGYMNSAGNPFLTFGS